MSDVERASESFKQARVAGHPDQAGILGGLRTCLANRFNRFGALEHLNKAIEMSEMAVSATQPSSTERLSFSNKLVIILQSKFKQSGAVDDLEKAIKATEEMLEATPVPSVEQKHQATLATWFTPGLFG